MGLDSIELVMAVEEKFGITVSDEEAQEMRTVGEMCQCVLRKVAVSDRYGRRFIVVPRSAGAHI
jgi:hypothetical protein